MFSTAKKLENANILRSGNQTLQRTDSVEDMGPTGISRKQASVAKLRADHRKAGKTLSDDSAFDPEESPQGRKLITVEQTLSRKVATLQALRSDALAQVMVGLRAGLVDPVATARHNDLGAHLKVAKHHLSAVQALRAGDPMPAMQDALDMHEMRMALPGKAGETAALESFKVRHAIAAHATEQVRLKNTDK